uniref:Uncharacterized protein n=1 Tax=Tetraselmis sp. GSL018 TaxID=582737 RepID=A0A061QTU7_9CHLO|mmetsp:Transcript_42428/g.100695  ORF Transcript_42428/g.100695 Transcript_42428/m.100695 type:complete len:161 (-) Transcript_42428:58-540(-)
MDATLSAPQSRATVPLGSSAVHRIVTHRYPKSPSVRSLRLRTYSIQDKSRNESEKTAVAAEQESKKLGISFEGVKQLVMMGMGTVAGDIKEINLNDPQRTVVMELEANNFEDADGNPISYIQDEGYVDEGAKFSPLSVAVPAALGVMSLAGIALTLKALS